jgi:hypothetical protein
MYYERAPPRQARSRLQASGFRLQAPGSRLQASGFWLQEEQPVTRSTMSDVA